MKREKLKKALAIILVCVLVSTLGGCGSMGQNMELSDENVQTEEEICFLLEAYTLAGGMLNVTTQELGQSVNYSRYYVAVSNWK